MRIYQAGASEVYLDGKLIHKLGVVSTNSDSINYYSPNMKPLSFPLVYSTEQVLAIRFLNLPPPYPIYSNKNIFLQAWITNVDNATEDNIIKYYKTFGSRINIGIGVGTILCFLYFSFFIFFPAQKINLYFSLCNFFFACTLVLYSIDLETHGPHFTINTALNICSGLYLVLLLYCTYQIFNKKKGWIYWSLFLLQIVSVLLEFFIAFDLNTYLTIIVLADILRISMLSLRNNKSGAWIILVVAAIDLIYSALSILSNLAIINIPNIQSYLPFALLVAPVGLAIYLGYAFGLTSQSLRLKLTEVEQLSVEKQQILSAQNETLEKQVMERTSALNQSLENLKSTQSQLIQSEKMASLGELTAGIAHEIQNPLNFINNFSEVNNELIEEIDNENDVGEIKLLAKDIKQNSEKILFHGKRADAIVKGMLQHSRSSSGQKEPTDINALTDEYLRLAYHGLRAKDKSFNATLQTDYEKSIETINIIPQDIGRVVLNLITNAFYVVAEKCKLGIEGYEPTVSVSTKQTKDVVSIAVKDNGNGITQKVLEKIFQPFFTTKPTGEGTGLGLSLAYDIVKAHGGELKVETKEGQGSTFFIQLPV
ncbi:MAG: GHKL domain-containing protein [Chitinophagaceae bacterium]|nr:GHKL domain-containing protein [Chitinophagaceae bacterium]